jgi:hypothetical protein
MCDWYLQINISKQIYEKNSIINNIA